MKRGWSLWQNTMKVAVSIEARRFACLHYFYLYSIIFILYQTTMFAFDSFIDRQYRHTIIRIFVFVILIHVGLFLTELYSCQNLLWPNSCFESISWRFGVLVILTTLVKGGAISQS